MTGSFYRMFETDSFMQEPSPIWVLLVWMCLYISTYDDSSKIIFYISGNCQVILKRAQCEVTDVQPVFTIYLQYVLCAKQNARKRFWFFNLLLSVYQHQTLAGLLLASVLPDVTEIFLICLLTELAHDMLFVFSKCSVVLGSNEVW